MHSSEFVFAAMIKFGNCAHRQSLLPDQKLVAIPIPLRRRNTARVLCGRPRTHVSHALTSHHTSIHVHGASGTQLAQVPLHQGTAALGRCGSTPNLNAATTFWEQTTVDGELSQLQPHHQRRRQHRQYQHQYHQHQYQHQPQPQHQRQQQ